MEEAKGEEEVNVILREYNEVRDFEMVMKLEKSCKNIGSCGSNNEVISIFSCMTGNDPLCRIRLYPLHVMLIAELVNNGEIVGMIRGCIKHVETGPDQGRRQLKLGSILGLRISPTHRRKGVSLKLVKSMEDWMKENGANYTFLATEENNVASTNLFTLKCNYTKLTPLTIFVQPLNIPSIVDNLPEGTEIKKLPTEQAISLYNTHLQNKHIYPTDINMILGEKLSLGTWLCYFKDENIEINTRITGGSWAIFSIWNTCDAYYKLDDQVQNSLSNMHNEKEDNYIENPKPFGFLFIYGLIGEGKRVGELVKCLWSFALGMAENVKDCKAIMTELGFLDPLIEYVPKQASISCIKDLWYVKKVSKSDNDKDDMRDDLAEMESVGNVFVDPRDF